MESKKTQVAQHPLNFLFLGKEIIPAKEAYKWACLMGISPRLLRKVKKRWGSSPQREATSSGGKELAQVLAMMLALPIWLIAT